MLFRSRCSRPLPSGLFLCPNIVARTSIPVPKVYLYCSTPKNPVRAEWILMEYMPGLCLADGFEQLTYEQKLRTATDVAEIMFSLFNITSADCGSISPHTEGRSDESLSHISPRYPLIPQSQSHPQRAICCCWSHK